MASREKIFWTGIFITALIIGGVSFIEPENIFNNTPLHAVIESFGFLCALFLAALLLISQRFLHLEAHFVWIAGALIGMGLLDGFHSFTAPGEKFVWLQSTSGFVGGMLFSLVWLPRRFLENKVLLSLFPKLVLFSVLLHTASSHIFSDSIPAMVVDGKFTGTALFLNLSGGAFFLAASSWFFIRFRRTDDNNDFLFCCLSLLFGLGAVLFNFSQPWDTEWWLRHFVRLAAYCISLVFIMKTFVVTTRKLSHESTAGAVKADLATALLLRKELDEIAYQTLEHARKLTESEYGFVGYIDPETGYLISPTLTRDIWEKCAIHEKSMVFKKFAGLWGWVLENRKPILTNTPKKDYRSIGTPEGHIEISRFLSVPAMDGDTLVGQIALANASRDYTHQDQEIISQLATLYAIAIKEHRALARIKELEARFRATFEQAAAGVAHVSPDGKWLRTNRKLTEITEYSPEELRKMNFQDITLPEDLEADNHYVRQLLAGEIDTYSMEKRYMRKSGEPIWVNNTVSVVRKSSGEPEYLIVIIEDIHARKHIEEALENSRQSLKEAQEIAHLGSWEWEIATGHEKWSVEQFRIFGYEPREVEPSYELFVNALHPDDRERVLDAVRDSLEKDAPYDLDYRIVLPDGGIKTIMAQGKIHRDEDGNPTWMLGTVLDITEREHFVASLRESEERAKAVSDNSLDAIIIIDDRGVITYFNDAAVRMLGYRKEEAIGRELHSFLVSEKARAYYFEKLPVFEKTGQCEVTGKVLELNAVSKAGKHIPVEVSISAFVIKGKWHAVGAMRDITERKNAERRLKNSEEKLKEAQTMAQLGHWKWNVKTGEVEWSDEVYRIFRLDPQEFTPHIDSVMAMSPWPEDSLRHKEIVQSVLDGRSEGSFEQRFLRPDGSTGHYYSTYRGEFDDSGDIHSIRGTVQDITDRKRAEIELAEKEERIRLLLNSTAEAIYGLDMNGNCTFANPACLRILGYEREEDLLGKRLHNLIHHTRADGSHYPEKECRIYAGFRRGEQVHVDDEVLWRRDGGSFPAEYWSHPLKRNGVTTGCVVTFLDITERKRSREELQRYAESQAVLLKEVNHRVKNNLAVIISLMHKEEERTTQAGASPYLSALRELAGRIEGLLTVHTMLSETAWRPLALEDLCGQVVHNVLRGVPYGKTAEVDIASSGITVNSSQAHHLTLVLNELTTNVIKHPLRKQDSIRISIAMSINNRDCVIRFQDNGPGFPAWIVDGDFSDCGIGFDLIRGIVRKSLGGDVSFFNDNGAVVVISFRNNE